MLIGQAPGIKEQQQETLFIGPAGRRLFKWLRTAGFTEERFRSFCYLTAVMKCFPGKGGRGDLKPTREQLDNCAEWLNEELKIVQPEVIIPTGQLAIERFLGKVRLADVVGKMFKIRIDNQETVIIPLPHPSGASAWANSAENLNRIKRALKLIKSAGRSSLICQR